MADKNSKRGGVGSAAGEPLADEKSLELRHKYLGGDLVEILTAPTPKDWVLWRESRGKMMVPYVPGHRFIEVLNTAFGMLWSFDVLDRFEKDGHVVVKGQLMVKVPGGKKVVEYPDGRKETVESDGITIVKTQYGSAEIKMRKDGKGMVDYGDDYKAAATDAMKKCGWEFGMFLDVYGSREIAEAEAGPTASHLEALMAAGEESGRSQGETRAFCEEKYGKPLEELTADEVKAVVFEFRS